MWLERLAALLDRIWLPPLRFVLGLVEVLGQHLILLFSVLRWALRPPYRIGVLLEAMVFIGFESLPIVLLISLFVGAVFALQLSSALRTFPAEAFTGATVGLALARELAPVFTSIVVSARAGAGMATELGSMRITEQIDALATMAVNPVQYLIVPRVLAGTMMVPMLAMLFNCVGMLRRVHRCRRGPERRSRRLHRKSAVAARLQRHHPRHGQVGGVWLRADAHRLSPGL
jgi:ABC-type transporter Mla maintaining outer membrane lipid asymmetry permease subunit MlaE